MPVRYLRDASEDSIPHSFNKNNRGVEMKTSVNKRNMAFTGAAIFGIVALGGCMGEGPKPDSILIQAQTVVDQADRAGTRNYAAFDLNNAHSKLKDAEEKMNAGEYKKARYLAKEAKVDAELALAKTQTAKVKESEAQIRQSLQTLKNEINNPGNIPQ